MEKQGYEITRIKKPHHGKRLSLSDMVFDLCFLTKPVPMPALSYAA